MPPQRAILYRLAMLIVQRTH